MEKKEIKKILLITAIFCAIGLSFAGIALHEFVSILELQSLA